MHLRTVLRIVALGMLSLGAVVSAVLGLYGAFECDFYNSPWRPSWRDRDYFRWSCGCIDLGPYLKASHDHGTLSVQYISSSTTQQITAIDCGADYFGASLCTVYARTVNTLGASVPVGWIVELPLLGLAFPLGCYPLLTLMRGPIRRRRRQQRGWCIYCGYDLEGNVSGICPECGQPNGASNAGEKAGSHDPDGRNSRTMPPPMEGSMR
jgi:hypothetical protein